MIIKLIETVYQFLWGDLIHIPLPGGGKFRNLTSDPVIISSRNRIYNKNKIPTDPLISRYGKSTDSKQQKG